jgi:Zinc finger, C2H2 type
MASSKGSCLNCHQIYYQQSLLPLDYVDFAFGGQKISLIGCFVESQPKPTTFDGPKICLTCLELLRTCHSASKRTVMANDSLHKPTYVCATCYQLSPANNLMNIRLTVINIDGRQVNLEQCVKKTMRTDASLMICLACLSVIVEEYQQLDENRCGPPIEMVPELVEIKIEPGIIVNDDIEPIADVQCKLEPVEDPSQNKLELKTECASPESESEPFENDTYSRKQHFGKKKRYFCAHCPSSFRYRSHFSVHVDNHRTIKQDQDKEFKCHHCPKRQFTRKHSLKEHLERFHFPQETPPAGNRKRHHSCPVCAKKYYNRNNFADHLEEHKELEKLQCAVCLKTFQKMSQFVRHLRKQKGVFKCTKCEQGFHHPTAIDKHMELVHNESYVCKICSLPLFTRRTFETHQLVRHGIKTKARCKYCGQQFDTKEALKEHVTQHKEAPKRPLVCEHCGQCFRQENDLRLHQESHTALEKTKCHLCPKKFKNSRTLANHIQTIHLRKKVRVSKTQYPCTLCPLRFERRQHLEGHMIVHNTENRPFFQCNKCGIAYTRRQKLQIHVTKCPKMNQEGFVNQM